jgi:hypothetical protein
MMSKLYVFGCSYATGEELLAHELSINDYRLATSNDPRKFFKKLETENLQEEYNTIKEKQKLIAWPQLLADKLNLQCCNYAESGNSLDKIVYQVFENNYKFTNNDIVIVSLTKATRNAIFDKNVESFQLPSLLWPYKGLLGVKDTGDIKPVINEQTDKALIDWFSDDRISWDFVKNLQVLEYYNINIVPAMNNNIISSMPVILDLYEKSKSKFLTDKGLDFFCGERLAWGHPDKDAHINYAEHLYEILR